MSTTIDERVVSMEFDNSHFEKNVRTTMSTLDKLKQSLNLTRASKGLESINSAASGFKSTGLGSAVEAVSAKFSALQVMGVTALTNITNSAVNAGKRIAAALTIEPIKMGFSEYETQINAVQTILANTESKGTTLDQVNEALDELNHYADKTIYNFTQMTRNIGTFTAAGVDLDTSVSAIKGIANLAAVSGSNSQQASTAMYQLSQALASGTVKLMDWNSVVNAGMGGQVFQDALKETARVHGIAIDDMIKKEGSFRETLSNGWLSSEILTETLSKFTGDLTDEQLRSMGYTEEQIKSIQKLGQTANDAATKVKTFTQLKDTLAEALQSGWTQSWEIMIGDFEEAKSLWTDVSDYFSEVINKSAEARNNLLQGWADGGGRKMAIESIKNAFNGLLSVIEPIKEAFREVFPAITVDQLLKITKAIHDFTAKLKLSDAQSEKLKSTFKGLFSIVKVGVNILSNLLKGVLKVAGSLSGFANLTLDIGASFGEWLTNISESIIKTNIFGKAINKVSEFLSKASNKITEFLTYSRENFVPTGFEGFVELLSKLWDSLIKVGGKFLEVGLGIGDALANVFGSSSLKSLFDLVNSGLLTAILVFVTKIVKGFSEASKGIEDIGSSLNPLTEIKNIVGGVKGVLESVGETLKTWQTTLKVGMLLKLAIAIGVLAVALVTIASINPERLAQSLGAITVLFADLLVSMNVFNKINGDYNNAFKAITVMIGMSIAISILASSLKKISNLKFDELMVGLVGISNLLAMLVIVAKVIGRDDKAMIKGASQMVIMAVAIKILASACEDLSGLDWNGLAKGVSGIGGLLAEIVIFSKFVNGSGISIKSAIGMIGIAAAMKIFASVCNDFSSMKWEEIGKGLASVGGLLAELGIFIKSTGNSTKIMSTSIALVIMSGALKIMASAINDLGSMDWDKIGRGLVAMAGALTALTLAMNLMPKNMISTSVGLAIAASSLLILSKALKQMSSMNFGEIGKAMLTLGSSIAILAIGLNYMSNTLQGSAALLVAAVALNVFAPALQKLGSMSLAEIGKGLLTIAGTLVIIGVASLALTEAVPVVLAFSLAITAIGIACAAVGAGISLAATGLALLIGVITTAAPAIVAALGILVTGIGALIPTIISNLGEAIILFCEMIKEAAPSIGEAVKALLFSLIDVLIECVPGFVEGIFKMFVKIFEVLDQYTPQLIDTIHQWLMNMIHKFSEKIPELTQAIVDLFMTLFQGVADAMQTVDTKVMLAGLAGLGVLTLWVAALAAVAPLVPLAMIAVVEIGAMVAELALVLAAIGQLDRIDGLDQFISGGGNILQAVGTAIGQFFGGLGSGLASGMSSKMPQVASDLSSFMTNLKPFLDGIDGIDSDSLKGVTALSAAIIALTSANLIKGLTSFITGDSSLSEFGREISKLGPYVKEYSDSVKGVDAQAIANSAVAVKALCDVAKNIPNSGGLVGLIGGENDIDVFGEQLASFGKAISEYSQSVTGLDTEAIVSSATAAQALSDLANTIPNTGGLVSFFAGDNDMATFGEQLSSFGEAISDYSQSVTGIDTEAIVASATAIDSMVTLADKIPNTGGLVTWFAGDNDMSTFGEQLASFGEAIRNYSYSVTGINTEAITSSATAAEALCVLANNLPNTGGIVTWFAGDNDLSTFADQLIEFGEGMSAYSEVISGINPEAITASATAAEALTKLSDSLPNTGGLVSLFAGDQNLASLGLQLVPFGKGLKSFSDSVIGIDNEAVTAAANAGKTLAEMASIIPNEGGLVAWFAGENSVASFGLQIAVLGKSLKSFSDNVEGINPTNVTAAATAAKSIAEMANTIPNEGGIVAWFAGDNSLGKFGPEISSFGYCLKAFSNNVEGINIANITAACAAGKSLAELANIIPNEGGVVAWFAGENSMAKFGPEISSFGYCLKAFANNVEGIKPENITAAAKAGKSLAEMASIIPNEGGLVAWFSGDNSVAKFGPQIADFGKYLKKFSDNVAGIKPENVTAASTAGKTLAEMADTLPKNLNKIDTFGSKLETLATNLKTFQSSMEGVDVTTAAAQVDKLVKLAQDISAVNPSTLSSFGKSLRNVAEDGVEKFVIAFNDAHNKAKEAVNNFIQVSIDSIDNKKQKFHDSAKKIMEKFIDGLESKRKSVKSKSTDIASDAADSLDDNYSDFYDAGEYLVEGFANGIDDSSYKAKTAAKAMAKAAKKAAEEALRINSPSKEFYEVGDYSGKGFVNALNDYCSISYKAGSEMANSARNGLDDAISKVSDYLNSDMDTQPTIRPVLDLSDIKSGADKINGLFNRNQSIGLLSNVGTISSMMNQRNQNGVNSDVVSAINQLHKDLGNVGNTSYTINGITYDDGSNVSDAVQTLVRAVRVERRM